MARHYSNILHRKGLLRPCGATRHDWSVFRFVGDHAGPHMRWVGEPVPSHADAMERDARVERHSDPDQEQLELEEPKVPCEGNRFTIQPFDIPQHLVELGLLALALLS